MDTGRSGLRPEGPLGAWLAATLDWLGTGIVLVDGHGQVLYGNARAEEIIARQDGMKLREGRLVLGDSDYRSQIGALLGRAVISGTVEVEMLPRKAQERPLILIAAPLAENQNSGAVPRVFVLFLIEPEPSLQLAANLLARAYGLTKMEHRVLDIVLQGTPPPEAARKLALGYSTVRSHLLNLFRKMLVHGQADLIRLSLTSMVNLERRRKSGRGSPARGKRGGPKNNRRKVY